jgi:hypothetical protein
VTFRVRAGVAQLVEQRFRKPQVVRSIRIAGSIVFAHSVSAPLSRRIGNPSFSCGAIGGSSECVRWHALFSMRRMTLYSAEEMRSLQGQWGVSPPLALQQMGLAYTVVLDLAGAAFVIEV